MMLHSIFFMGLITGVRDYLLLFFRCRNFMMLLSAAFGRGKKLSFTLKKYDEIIAERLPTL